jgi:hypothetical protein
MKGGGGGHEPCRPFDTSPRDELMHFGDFGPIHAIALCLLRRSYLGAVGIQLGRSAMVRRTTEDGADQERSDDDGLHDGQN